MKLAGKIALVTGGASGIGLGIAHALSARGVHIAIADLRAAAVREVTAALQADGGRASGHVLDVARRDEFAAVVDAIENFVGPIDILVNNAGVGYAGTPLHATPDEDIDWVIGVNLLGVLNGIKAVVPRMIVRGVGHVVNVSSMSGLALPTGIHHGLYGATKAAVVFLSEGLRQDVAALGIDVSVLVPGYVRTNLPHSGAYRGERYGGPLSRDISPEILLALQRALEPRAVGEMTVRAIEERQFLVLTDLGEARDVADWHARVAAAIDVFDPGR